MGKPQQDCFRISLGQSYIEVVFCLP